MISKENIYWIAGFLEGEGCFSLNRKTPLVSAGQKQKHPLEQLQFLLGGRIYKAPRHCYQWNLLGIKGVGLMMTLFNLLSPKRQLGIKKVIKQWKTHKPAAKYRTHCPQGHMYSIENTYIYNETRACRICHKEQKKGI